ncbi:hypothetical protein PLESTM_000893100 [Pleodorina starrii]|nr:hypothetical protein PLESTM_000893100 [Pleodorina starrii]
MCVDVPPQYAVTFACVFGTRSGPSIRGGNTYALLGDAKELERTDDDAAAAAAWWWWWCRQRRNSSRSGGSTSNAVAEEEEVPVLGSAAFGVCVCVCVPTRADAVVAGTTDGRTDGQTGRVGEPVS